MQYTAQQIAELFPDLTSIKDEHLRAKVAAVWSEALTTGCGGKGWTFDEIRAIPFTLLAGKIDMRFVEHLNSCVRQCIMIEQVLKQIYGSRVPIDHDALCGWIACGPARESRRFHHDSSEARDDPRQHWRGHPEI